MYLRHVFLTVMMVLGCASANSEQIALKEQEAFRNLLTVEFKRISVNEVSRCMERGLDAQICTEALDVRWESLRTLCELVWGPEWRTEGKMLSVFILSDTVDEVRALLIADLSQEKE